MLACIGDLDLVGIGNTPDKLGIRHQSLKFQNCYEWQIKPSLKQISHKTH